MPICKICGKELKKINYTHLKVHNITLDEYMEKYPDADIGDQRWGATLASDDSNRQINLHENGNNNILNVNQTTFMQFTELRKKHDLSVMNFLRKLMELWVTNENSGKINMILNDVSVTNAGLPENFAIQHREILQEFLSKYEKKALDEDDPNVMGKMLNDLVKTNLALPQLEKSYDSSADRKLEEVVVNRKAVFNNILPEENPAKLLKSLDI